MSIARNDSSDTTNIVSSGDHGELSDLELDVIDDLVVLKGDLDGVVNVNKRVRVADGASVVGDNERNGGSATGLERVGSNGVLVSPHQLADTAELEGGFLLVNRHEGESSLGVVQQTEVLSGFVKGDNIHESGWEVHISADLLVDLDETVHDNDLHLSTGERVLEAVTEEHDHRDRLTQLVRTRRGARSVDSAQFGQHPCLWRYETFQMFLMTATLTTG